MTSRTFFPLSDAPAYTNELVSAELYKTRPNVLLLQTGTAGLSQISAYINLVGTTSNDSSPEYEMSLWYRDNVAGLLELRFPAKLMVSSWAIVVDLSWEKVLATPVAVYGTVTAGVPAAVF
jgi:hypothetical protein